MRTTWRDLQKTLAIQLVNLYSNSLSHIMLHSCRFIPTCAVYTKRAIERHGTIKGLWLGAVRILRCHPFSNQIVDPVK